MEQNVEQLLSTFLPELPEQTKLSKARQILGEQGRNITDDQLETFIAQFEFLLNCWLDSYEKQLFTGKTLKELTR